MGFLCFLVGGYWYWVCFGQLGVRFGSGFVTWELCLVLGLSVCGLVSM